MIDRAMTEVVVESARQQWATGHRRLADPAADRNLYLSLLDQVGVVLDELSRRVGQTFTLAELAEAYRESDRWLLDVLGSRSGGVTKCSHWSGMPPSTSMRAEPSTTRHEASAAPGPATSRNVGASHRGAPGPVRDRGRGRSGDGRRVAAVGHEHVDRTLEPATLSAETVTVTVTTTPRFQKMR